MVEPVLRTGRVAVGESEAGEPTANEDLWDKILKSISKLSKIGMRVDFVYQKGKTTDIGKKVDSAAKNAAQRGGIDRDTGYKPGSYSRSMVRDGAAAKRFPASGQGASNSSLREEASEENERSELALTCSRRRRRPTPGNSSPILPLLWLPSFIGETGIA